ncbi:MAG: hypothetical protein IJ871_09100 [Ruminococcus sp.]|nr:hypothetical protein [Ruminococcus sp.]
MNNNSDNNIYEALKSVAKEPNNITRLDDNDNTYDKTLYHMWIYAIVVSVLPLLSVPFFLVLKGSFSELKTQLLTILSGSEIVFIAVSLTTISTNDISDSNGRKQRWIKANQLLVIFGSMVYSAMSIAEYESNDYNIYFALFFNVIFLSVTIALGKAAYLKD